MGGASPYLPPEDKYKVERTIVGRSCGALGLQEKLDDHSAVLIRIIWPARHSTLPP